MPDVSPIIPLVQHIAASPYAQAWERRDELKQIIDHHKIGIVFDGANPETLVKVVHDTNEIHFGVRFAEQLWAYCFAYMLLIEKLDRIVPGEEFDLSSDADWDAARRLLEWAHNGMVKGVAVPWPDDLPKPTVDESASPQLLKGTAMFLCMAGWVFLHEIGHVVCGHGLRRARDYDESESREYQADDWASAWLLENWDTRGLDDEQFITRSLGAAFALSIIASFEVYQRTNGGFEHPDPAERLLHFLDRHCPESAGADPSRTDSAWLAAIAIMQLHLYNVGKPIELKEYATLREVLVAAVGRLDCPARHCRHEAR